MTLLFQRLYGSRIVVYPDKYEVGKAGVTFLGHEIAREDIEPSKNKVRAMLDYAVPSSINELTTFLGLLNSYRHFIPHAAERLIPLIYLLTGNHVS